MKKRYLDLNVILTVGLILILNYQTGYIDGYGVGLNGYDIGRALSGWLWGLITAYIFHITKKQEEVAFIDRYYAHVLFFVSWMFVVNLKPFFI